MKVFLFARFVRNDYLEPLTIVLDAIARYGWQGIVSRNLHEFLLENEMGASVTPIDTYEDLRRERPEIAITLGGDGTILAATCLIRDLSIPIMGINLGRLGFLSSVERKKIDWAMERLVKEQYHIDQRTMLYLESEPSIFGPLNFALNDFTVHKRDTSSMVSIRAFINGDYLNTYWADGLIVSTPTGSTGYSLSCGGPIVFPSSGNMIITPVAPHNLNVRPLVISDNSVISFSIEGRAKNFLCTLDSRNEVITAEHQLAIRKCDFMTNLVVLSGHSFLHTIHEKLSWGADRRN